MDSGNENLSVYSIHLDVIFLSDTDRRATCAMCAIPTYQSLSDTEPDPGYDEYIARFELDSDIFKGYSGNTQFSIIMENRTEVIVWDNVFEVTIEPASSGDSGSLGSDYQPIKPILYLTIFAGLIIGLYKSLPIPILDGYEQMNEEYGSLFRKKRKYDGFGGFRGLDRFCVF